MDEYSILRKKRKKNGFAATSLLISIALALLVLVGAVLILGKVDNQNLNAVNDDSNVILGSSSETTCVGLSKEMIFNDNLRNIKEAAVSYFTNERLPQTVGDTVKITLKEMKEKKIILNVIDSNYKSCLDDKTYVEVTKEENEYVMKIFLSCSDMEDYILVHLGCYDYCESKVCEKKEVVKQYEYEYKKTISCTMTPWSSWGNWQTTREKTSNLKKEETKVETSTKETVDTKEATKNVTYNCDKYPGYTLVGKTCVKETTTTDVKEATPSKYSYNCDKYPGYSVVGTKCVKETTTTDVKEASENPATYNCDKYPGYTLSGTKCVKKITTTDTKDAIVNYSCDTGYTLSGTTCVKKTTTTDTKNAKENYSCDTGYTLDGKTCVKKTTTTDTKNATVSYSCSKYSGYTLSGTKCVKTTTTTKDAEPEYSTRTKTQTFTCYKQECTTKTVFTCPTGKSCGNYPQTSCENVKKTCSQQVSEKYVSGYKCSDSSYKLSETKDGKKVCVKTTTDTKDATVNYNCDTGYTLDGKTCKKTTTTTDKKNAKVNYSCDTGYTLDGKTCTKTTTTTDKKNAKVNYSCDTGYTLDGKTCTKTTTTTDKKNATKNPTTYNCDNYSGYTLDGTKCKKTTTTKDTKTATKVPGGYVCTEGYTLNGTKCSKTTTTKDVKEATSKTTYTCPTGYTRNNNTCTKKNTEEIKTTYYRYATRTCEGGSTSTKWSTSKNDSILKGEGYKLTGNKREIKEIIK